MRFKSSLDKEHWLNTPAFKDLIVIGVISIEAYVLVQALQLVETIDAVSKRYETWHVEKFITIPVILLFAFALYAGQRWIELRREIVKHKQTEKMLHQRTIESQQAKNAAEKANKTKSEFIANMSHELRTPLHGILSFASFGIKKYSSAEPEKILDYFTKIRQSGETLLSLLNNLLDMSKLESGKMIFEFKPADVGMLIKATTEEFYSLLSERGLIVRTFNCDSNLMAVVDAEKIKQVVRNLIGNAIKFSPRNGSINITLTSEDGSLLISVRDEGAGIPENELEAIFEKFVQSSRSKSGAGGTGLGLAICREIVTQHKGRIWAENNPEKGSTFYFVIPLPVAELNGENIDNLQKSEKVLVNS